MSTGYARLSLKRKGFVEKKKAVLRCPEIVALGNATKDHTCLEHDSNIKFWFLNRFYSINQFYKSGLGIWHRREVHRQEAYMGKVELSKTN